MEKRPFVTKGQLEEIVKEYPTPFHLYDEKGIRANAQAVKDAGEKGVDYSLYAYQYAFIVCSIVPIIILYPKLQKYFAAGVNVGGVKE